VPVATDQGIVDTFASRTDPQRHRAEAYARELADARSELAALVTQLRFQQERTRRSSDDLGRAHKDVGQDPSSPVPPVPGGPEMSTDARDQLLAAGPVDHGETARAGEGGEQLPPTAKIIQSLRENGPDTGELLQRGRALLARGDVSGGRLLLERASSMGEARAAFLLAETYDPGRLVARRSPGLRGDADMARRLYNEAYAGGIAEARQRLEALR
jgi:hypothetical protein